MRCSVQVWVRAWAQPQCSSWALECLELSKCAQILLIMSPTLSVSTIFVLNCIRAHAVYCPADWEAGTESTGSVADGRLSCLVCRDGVWRMYRNCSRHEKSQKHQSLISFFEWENSHTHSKITLTSHSTVGREEPLIALDLRPETLGPLVDYAFYRTQTGRLPINMVMEENEDNNGSIDDNVSNNEYDLGNIDLDYTLEETVDSIIAAKLSMHIEEWLNEGSDRVILTQIHAQPTRLRRRRSLIIPQVNRNSSFFCAWVSYPCQISSCYVWYIWSK